VDNHLLEQLALPYLRHHGPGSNSGKLEKNGEENHEKGTGQEDDSKEWFCPVYGWLL